MKRGGRGVRKPSPAFLRSAARTDSKKCVSEALLKQARRSGQLNLSNRSLEVVPEAVWSLNTDPSLEQTVSFGAEGGEKWWDQVDITKLILAVNQIKEIPDDIRLLTALTTLDIHSNRLTKLPEAIGELVVLKRLILSHNELACLPQNLVLLTELNVLKLDHNKLSSLPAKFGSLANLEDLDVSHNLLSSLPSSVGEIPPLRVLTATHNMLESLPESLGSHVGLEQLSLNNNKLSTLPDLSGASALQVLFCNYNNLSSLPLLQENSKLKELHCGFNRVCSIDSRILSRLQSLVHLDLRDNRISSIPECVVDIATLERLNLMNNDLTSLPYAMGNMSCLKSLSLEGNPLRGIRREIIQKGTMEVLKYLKTRVQSEESSEEPVHHSTKFTPTKQKHTLPGPGIEKNTGSSTSLQGKVIDLSKRELFQLPEELFSNVSLTALNVSYNKLEAIPPQIAAFTSLSVLNISKNRIRDLPQELEKCVNLRDIVLSYNSLSTLPEVIFSIKSIENVIANDNQISSIDVDGLLQLPMLSTLDLQNNSISQVPPRLGTVTTLKHLELGGNPFRIPRAAILTKGTASVLQYLRDRMPT